MLDFSVLMPVYIKENPEYLKLAIQSLLEQTVLPSEIVIVEDGPLTPALHEVINTFALAHPGKFNIIQLSDNHGMGYAMDTGLQQCKCDYVARMDSDDIARKDRFEIQTAFLKKHPEIDLLGSYIEEFSTNPGDLNRFRKVPVTHDDILAFARYRNPINHMTVMFKKKKALEVGSYWHKRVLEDYNLWYKMLKNGCKMHNLPDILMYARVGNNMVGRRRGIKYIKEELHFFGTMADDKFITRREYYTHSAARIAMKMLPTSVLNFLYSKLLRR
ncbi:MAG: glycosyltransferase [Chitinophaga sp.]|uniref:glycosyltransferase n=1 Tax=Chitinophaga sp. TaxID=1869181 RepID=UPI001B2A45EF|nr:glycosyltransferase [Chitinophaga sp.]MBO9731718.1 glycosyltransferase [Chitinophaga sp.]